MYHPPLLISILSVVDMLIYVLAVDFNFFVIALRCTRHNTLHEKRIIRNNYGMITLPCLFFFLPAINKNKTEKEKRGKKEKNKRLFWEKNQRQAHIVPPLF